jgi:Ca2+/H+ antiporter
VASIALYALFVVVQTVRHRDYFLPVEAAAGDDTHATPPSDRQALASLGFLIVALVAVVGLAKIESPAIEDAVAAVGAPQRRRRRTDRPPRPRHDPGGRPSPRALWRVPVSRAEP